MPEILPVSLILTTLNESQTIIPFLESVKSQSALPAEIVICDGGSTDNTKELISSWKNDFIQIRMVEDNGSTIARGRNTAIKYSSFEILAVSDSGCELHPDWLEKIVTPLILDDKTDAGAGAYIIGWKTPFQRLVSYSEMRVIDIPSDSFLPSSRSFVIRKNAWAEIGGYPEDLSFAGEDTALCLKLKSANKKLVQLLDACVEWYPRTTISSFIAQHILYGIGDGEGRIKHRFYYKILIKNIIAFALLCSTILYSKMIIIFILIILVYYLHLFRLYHWNEIPIQYSIGSYVLIIIKEWSVLAGWFKGLFRSIVRIR